MCTQHSRPLISERLLNVYKETVGRFERIQEKIWFITRHITLELRAHFKLNLKYKPASEFPVLPLVCMPRWLSVVTTALSLTALLVCFSFEMTTWQASESICMYAWGVSPGRPVMAPPTSPRTRRLPAIKLAVALVTSLLSPITAFGSSLSSPDPVTGMLAARVPPVHGHQPVETRRIQVWDIYQSGYIVYTSFATSRLLGARSHLFQEYHTFFRYILRYITKNRLYLWPKKWSDGEKALCAGARFWNV